MFWLNKFEKCNALEKKISKELMPVARHPKIWWNFCMSKDGKKEIKPVSTEKYFSASVVSNMGVSGHLGTQRLDIVQKAL